jgi:cyclopropane fatty-acyl-phospholipid synthase-like methyltransferase
MAEALPYSEACERNKAPILEVLRRWLGPGGGSLLEVGAGTGQHAVHFARHLPAWRWHASERAQWLGPLEARLAAAGTANVVRPPLELDVSRRECWPADTGFDAVFSANTLHIMGWPEVCDFYDGVGRVLREGGLLLVYGPFRYSDRATAPSNEAFDAALRARDPASGLRDFAAVDTLAHGQRLELCEDAAMPANNRMLVWRKGR